MMWDLKDDMKDRPETVHYGNRANNYKINKLFEEDWQLEIKNFQNISYTKKEKKAMWAKLAKLKWEDLYGNDDYGAL